MASITIRQPNIVSLQDLYMKTKMQCSATLGNYLNEMNDVLDENRQLMEVIAKSGEGCGHLSEGMNWLIKWSGVRNQRAYYCNYVDGLVQERRNSGALAMGLRISCTNSWTSERLSVSIVEYCKESCLWLIWEYFKI